MTPAQGITRARELVGLSQAELAAESGLKPSAISHFETGRRTPSLGSLLKLATALRCSLDFLVGREARRFCLVRGDGRAYLVPAGKRGEAFEVLDRVEDYWADLRRVEKEDPPATPAWLREVSAHRLTFSDPLEEE